MDALKAIETRKSTRSYLDKAVGTEETKALVMAAQNAPKAGRFHVTVITNKEILKEINDKALDGMKNSGNDFLMSRAVLDDYMPLYGAPMLVVLSAPDEEPYAPVNTACAATNVCVAATGLGLGSCFVVTPALALGHDPALCAKIGVPAGYKVFCGVLVGYAGEEKFAAPKEKLDNVNFSK